MNETPVFLTATEIEHFKNFMRYRHIIVELLDAKAFEIKNGSVVMDFNHVGDLMDIKLNTTAYKKGK